MIEAGIYDAQTMEVKSGLTAGDQVITTWSNELVDGQEVLLDSDNEQNENAQNRLVYTGRFSFIHKEGDEKWIIY